MNRPFQKKYGKEKEDRLGSPHSVAEESKPHQISKRRKLKEKFLLSVAVPVGVSLFIFLIVLILVVNSSFRRFELDKNLAFSIRLIDTASEAIDFRNWALIERTLIQNLIPSPDIAYIYVFDSEDNLQVSFDKSLAGLTIRQVRDHYELGDEIKLKTREKLWMIDEYTIFEVKNVAPKRSFSVRDFPKEVKYETIMDVSAELFREKRKIGSVSLGFNQRKTQEIIVKFSFIASVLGGLIVILICYLILILSSRIVKPIERISTDIESLSFDSLGLQNAHDLMEQLKVFKKDPDEFQIHESSKLRETFLRFRDIIIESIASIEKSSRHEALANMAQMLTHDMRAPIGTFERFLFTKDEDLPSMKGPVRESVNRLYAMIEALRTGQLENIVHTTSSKLDFSFGYQSLLAKAEQRGLLLTVPKDSFVGLLIDAPKIERAWINLATNALSFAKSFVRVEAKLQDKVLIILISDDGPGVHEEFLPRLFQRGATYGKDDGTGLGLSYVKQVMMGHGGDVRYYREDNLTVFECVIPKAFESKPSTRLDRTHLEQEVKQPASKKVGIAFHNDSLNTELMDRVRGVRADAVLWHIGFDPSYDFIITDDQATVEQCLDEGITVAEFKPGTPPSEIARKILIRLGIREGGNANNS